MTVVLRRVRRFRRRFRRRGEFQMTLGLPPLDRHHV